MTPELYAVFGAVVSMVVYSIFSWLIEAYFRKRVGLLYWWDVSKPAGLVVRLKDGTTWGRANTTRFWRELSTGSEARSRVQGELEEIAALIEWGKVNNLKGPNGAHCSPGTTTSEHDRVTMRIREIS